MNGLLLRDDTCPHYTYSIATRILAHSRKGVNVLEGGVSIPAPDSVDNTYTRKDCYHHPVRIDGWVGV